VSRPSGRGHVSGPLSEYGEGFREWLFDRGYTAGSAAHQVRVMAFASRWLRVHGLGLQDVAPAVATRWAADRRAQGYVNYRSSRAFAPMLEYLDGLGVLAADGPASATAAQRMVQRYQECLRNERGLAASSLRHYGRVAGRFLAEVGVGDDVGLERDVAPRDGAVLAGVTAAAVTAFMRRACHGRGRATAKATATALRSLLRYLCLHGHTALPLAPVVASAACWRLSGLPESLDHAQIVALLNGCDRQSAAGRRDLAMLSVLVRLGLRAGEVAALDLADIDWRAGEMTVRGKGPRRDRLPVPVDVGRAMADWLRQDRPRELASSAVFVRLRAPHHRLGATGVSAVVRRACRRAGIPTVGAHRLRHATATQLLRRGAPLREIGQLLRHRRAATTAIYAKVDVAALATLARPWPETR
jgi:integrase/recombinase XerD